MKKILSLVFVLSIALAGIAKDAEKEAPVFNPELKTVLAGNVIDQVTGEALAGVQVKVVGSDKSFYTDFDGNFEINGLIPGDYELRLSLVSYETNLLKKVEVLSQEKSAVKVEMKQ